MRWLKLTIAYDGTDFAGWQVQPQQRTVQAVLQAALEELTSQPTQAIASGRTDSGVHARGQVVSVSTQSTLSVEVIRRALNAKLPEDVVVLLVEEAAEGFHAIRDAVGKLYRYQLHDGRLRDLFSRRYLWQWAIPLDVDAMHRAAQQLCGKHDFSSFESTGAERQDSIRTIRQLDVYRPEGDDPKLIHIDIEADGFLYNMARAIVGTLTEVGRGAYDEQWPREVMLAKNRKIAGMTAPAQGLCLIRVDYD